MTAIALALAASLAWGCSDFLGGMQTRRQRLLGVLLVSQAAGLAIVLPVALVSGEPLPGGSGALWAMTAGLAELIAFAAFYRALAIGTMSVVAPISATAAAVPVLVGLAEGERPGGLQIAGMAAALAGVILASREPVEEGCPPANRAAIGLALVAAAGFGTFFVGIDRASATAEVPWVIVVQRCCSVSLLVIATLVVRPSLPRDGASLLVLAAVGLLDLGANGLYALATTKGLLSVVSVLGSLYPAVTVVLARFVLAERIARVQEVGVVLALAGVVAISAG
jgi:drug/metabolite transporter (DMT)-like permease